MQPQTTYQPQPTHPGRVVSIIGLIFAFVFLGVPGLVLSIIGLAKSKRSGKADVIAILGIIFNILSILIGGLIFGLLVLVAYNNVQAQARDTKRQTDASFLISNIETYHSQSNGFYPSDDVNNFKLNLAQFSADDKNKAIYNRVTEATPTKANPDRYNVALCGGTDAASATGMRVVYWSEVSESTKMLTTGTGCDDPTSDSQECGSDATIQDGASCAQGTSDGESLFN